jgi:glycosyltransferase involved in cell wall biosynthesis
MPDDRSVLHVLPHRGGGGETYVDALAGLGGYRADRLFLADGPRPSGAQLAIARRALRAQWARGYDILHVHGEVAAALCLGGLATRPSVLTLHGLHLVRRLHGLARAVARANLRVALRASTRTICVSEAERDDLLTFVARGSLRSVVVVRNGVRHERPIAEKDRAAARAELEIPSSAVVGAWVGGLDEHKDPLTPIRAARDVARAGTEFVLLVAGDGPMRSQVEHAARDSGAVRVLGFRDDVRRLLAASDVFVLSSRREGLSFALLEAMSLGLVPVVSDVAGNVEVVDGAGVVVPFGDDNAFLDALSMLANDARRRADLAARARDRIRDVFAVDAMRENTRRVYDNVLRERGQ